MSYWVFIHYAGTQIKDASKEENGHSGPKSDRRKQQDENIRNEQDELDVQRRTLRGMTYSYNILVGRSQGEGEPQETPMLRYGNNIKLDIKSDKLLRCRDGFNVECIAYLWLSQKVENIFTSSATTSCSRC